MTPQVVDVIAKIPSSVVIVVDVPRYPPARIQDPHTRHVEYRTPPVQLLA